MTKQILIYPISRRVDVSDRLHAKLCIYKIFWPPETTIQLGKKKVLKLSDFTPWPPPVQVGLGIEVEEKKVERSKDMG